MPPDDDPHVHAPAAVVDPARIRSVLTQVVGRGVSLPATVTTACGQRRPRAATSARPEAVTCLDCRRAAARLHTEAAAQCAMIVDAGFGTADDLAALRSERDRHSDLARRFGAG
jgi:hypothetical protein